MSTLNFLTRLADGTVSLVNAITSSAGVSDAEKVVATGANGRLSVDLLPPGVEIQIEEEVAGEALAAGDFITFIDDLGSRKVVKAIANDITRPAHGYVLSAVADTELAQVYTKGINTGVTTTTIGARYYLSTNTAGASTDTPPTPGLGIFQQVLGYGTGNGVLFEYDDVILLG